MSLFSRSFYIVLPQLKSNHSPLLITITKHEDAVNQRHKLFRFEAARQLREECSQVIEQVWSLVQFQIQSKLQKCKINILEWRKEIRKRRKTAIDRLFSSQEDFKSHVWGITLSNNRSIRKNSKENQKKKILDRNKELSNTD